MREALFYKKDYNSIAICSLCPHGCRISSGCSGLCIARRNCGGILIAESYGQFTSISLDPIEKKPLLRFYPGSMILSAGSYGCNMKCSYCQNHSISQEKTSAEYISPEELLRISKGTDDNLGIAFTYNEPIMSFEYILDAAPLFQSTGQKVVLVTNGMINPEPLDVLLPYIDAMNIDIKVFNSHQYKKLAGDLATVKNTVERSISMCHVEITALIVPEQNDSTEDMQSLVEWLAKLSPEIPLHVSRFFPRYKMTDYSPTPIGTMQDLVAIAQQHLQYVYLGNM